MTITTVISGVLLPSLSDRGAELGFDAVGLLQAAVEQLLAWRLIFRSAGGGEIRLQPGRELAVLGESGHYWTVARFSDAPRAAIEQDNPLAAAASSNGDTASPTITQPIVPPYAASSRSKKER